MATIGIDLGTYNSAAAWASDDGRTRMLSSPYGPTAVGEVFPSFVRFDDRGSPVKFGEDARLDIEKAIEFVVWGTKRFIGRAYNEVADQLGRFGYQTARAEDGTVEIRVGPGKLSPEQVAGALINWICESANNTGRHPFIDGSVDRAVVTHPAYFDDSQIKRTQWAAQEYGGLKEVVTIAEPVAAALAYGIKVDTSTPKFIMAIDWGAGTLDIATVVLRRNTQGLLSIGEIRPARGDVAFGGIDMDDALVRAAIDTYGLRTLAPIAPPTEDAPWLLRRADVDPRVYADMGRLRVCLEQAKIELSSKPVHTCYTTVRGAAMRLRVARSRDSATTERLEEPYIVLDEVLSHILENFRKQLLVAIQRSGVTPEQFHHVILIGGPLHMPCVRHKIREVFASNPRVVAEIDRLDREGFPVDPMEAVARGAALYGAGGIVQKRDERLPFAYGVALGEPGRECGKILVEVGELVGHDYPPEQERTTISAEGKPGDRIPVGLFKREDTVDREKYSRLGHFWFVSTYKNGWASFEPSLHIAEDRTLTLRLVDLLRPGGRDKPLELKRLDVLSGQEIGKPRSLGRDGDGSGRAGGPPRGDGGDGLVPQEQVAQALRRANNTVLIAQACLQRLPPDHSSRAEIATAIWKVEDARVRLPPGEASPQDRFQDVYHVTEQLRLRLCTEPGLVTENERKILGF